MAVFDGLQERLLGTIKKIKGTSRVTEKDIKNITREIKLALLEADVNYKVVKEFIKHIQDRALGQEILTSLTPGQQIIKIVKDELIKLMGGEEAKLTVDSKPPSIYVAVGLQGSGKTTHISKLANIVRKDGKKPLMVACDVYRPAAIKQLQVLGKQLDVEVYAEEDNKDVVDIAKNALDYANKKLYDTVLIDTAGRLQIDEELMTEVADLKKAIDPTEILLVVDAMSGQDAVNVAKTFNEKIGIDGIILTKMDGDTRGGAALSAKKVTGKPVKYVGTGEKISDIEVFYPDRMASRILGMGDVLTLIEKAEEAYDEEKAKKLEEKIRKQTFTLDDFLEQMQEMKKMGPMDQLLGMIPGMNNKALKNINIDEKQMVYTEAIIQSMTKQEKTNPNVLNASRRKRIAKGSGTSVQQVNKLINSFKSMKKMMKMMNNPKKLNKTFGNFNFPM